VLVAGCSNSESANGANGVEGSGANGASGAYVQPATEAYAPDIDADDFVSGVDHPYFPMLPGTTWIYEGVSDEGVEHVEVTVLDETRKVIDVDAVVVRDIVTVDGEVVEETYDWFAQDKDGNVWYLGEEVSNYEGGVFVDSEGSWEAGVAGALPGIIMWADPQPGEPYRQEYHEGEAEDMAKVIGHDGVAEVPFGRFTDVLVIEEWTPLEPGVAERKHYAEGVGLVQASAVKDGTGELVGKLVLVRMIATE
jgi:hypothetical protein